MPTYEYVCEACKHRFERFQSMTAAPVKVCPECGKRTVKRLIGTGAALLFKGSGFYITDYRSEGYKKKAEADKPSAAGGSAGESGSASPPASSAATAQTPAAKAGSDAPAKPAAKGEIRPKPGSAAARKARP